MDKQKIKTIKKLIKTGKYDWNKAINSTAEKILKHPEVLLWK